MDKNKNIAKLDIIIQKFQDNGNSMYNMYLSSIELQVLKNFPVDNTCIFCLENNNLIKNFFCSCDFYFHKHCFIKWYHINNQFNCCMCHNSINNFIDSKFNEIINLDPDLIPVFQEKYAMLRNITNTITVNSNNLTNNYDEDDDEDDEHNSKFVLILAGSLFCIVILLFIIGFIIYLIQ